MRQRDLDRALARATGESVHTISRLGFSLLDSDVSQRETDDWNFGPQTVDWDRLEAERVALAIQA